MAHTIVGHRAIVAVNGRASGLRDPEMVLDSILAAADGMGPGVSGVITNDEDDLREAMEAAEGGRLVLVGGDGSVHYALNHAAGPLEIGLVPMGRANNIARSLGLPRDVPNAARVALTAPAQPVDVMRVETPDRTLLGVEGVSAGLQAAARMRYQGENSGHLLEGVSAFAGALASYAPWRLTLELDGRLAYEGDAAGAFLSNFPRFAYGFKIDPRADVADGLLAAVVLEADTRHRVARLVLSAYRGTLGDRRHVTIAPAREAVLSTPVPMVCDSEVLGTTTASVRVEQGLLKIAA
jgi:diacylglycerol kinase family enzyme